MHAYLIVGANDNEKEKGVKSLIEKLKLKFFEFPVAKIEDVRELNRFAALSLSSPTGIVIKDIDQATDEALNAFLKNLEEPQENLYFILTASSLFKVLQTVASRCQLIKTTAINKGDADFALGFLQKDSVEKLLEMEKIKGREEALIFLEKFSLGLHHLLVTSDTNQSEFAEFLKTTQETYLRIKANGNVFLQLTNMVLSLG